MVTDTPTVPNHHAHHPGFAGVSGLLAALSFLVGRDADAEIAIARTALRSGEAVLDIGCGPGVAARLAARRGATVVGVDPAPVMLRIGRLLGRRGVRYELGAAEDLPVGDAAVDVTWSLSTVHHWRDLDAGLAEVRRVLRPGGRFLATEKRTHEGATGHAAHGWTDARAERFAELLGHSGFVDVDLQIHEHDRRPLVSVLARRP